MKVRSLKAADLTLVFLLLASTIFCSLDQLSLAAPAKGGKRPAAGAGRGGSVYPQALFQGRQVVRWLPQHMPIKVCISPGICLDSAGTDPNTGGPLSNVDNVSGWVDLLHNLKQNPDAFNNLPTAEGYNDQMWQAAFQGVNQWKRFQNEGLFSLEVSDNPEGADVYVFWTHHFVNKLGLALFSNDIRGYTAKRPLPYAAVANALNSGDTALVQRSRRPVVVVLRTTDLVGAQTMPMPQGKLVAAAAHEMGHVLGIDQHSTVPSDLMSVNYGRGTISANDTATIRYLYKHNPDLVL